MHISVLQKEIIKYLEPKANENFIDCTFGEGGHTRILLRYTKPKGKVLGIEIDPELYQKAKKELVKDPEVKDRLVLVNDSYANLVKIVEKENFQPVHGILLDLGMSSWHLEESARGFSFKKEEPLDMRYNPQARLKAKDIVNSFSREDLEKILKEYGEEPLARKIAGKIIEKRKVKPIQTSRELAELVKEVIGKKRGKIHPATKTFQALRIAVNGELENLKKVLPQALAVLEPGGRLAVISFHSLEDRIVKLFFRQSVKEGKIVLVNKKVVRPSKEEIKTNPRSRSAKLRVVKKL